MSSVVRYNPAEGYPIRSLSADRLRLADELSLEVFKGICRDYVMVAARKPFAIHLGHLPRNGEMYKEGFTQWCDHYHDSIRLVDDSGAIVVARPGLYWWSCDRYPEHKRVVTPESVKLARKAHEAAWVAHEGRCAAVAAYCAVRAAYEEAALAKVCSSARYKASWLAKCAARDAVKAAECDARAYARAAFEATLVEVSSHDH